MLRIYSISLGCPKNRVDSERALGHLAALHPLSAVSAPQEGDLVFINTCGFIAPAVEESVRAVLGVIRDIADLPEKKRPLLALAGCLVGRYGAEALAPDLPEVDLWLDNRRLEAWGTSLEAALAARGQKGGTARTAKGKTDGGAKKAAAAAGRIGETAGTEAPRPARLLSTGPSYAWLKISDGCRHACAFCTIPSIRGPLKSSPKEALLREAGQLLATGVKELVVIAQDSTAWGLDLGLKHGLKSLLEALLPLPGLGRLRLMYLYPAGLDDDLLAFLRSAGPPFVPYFDIPLQHAAPGVLKRMGRPFAGKPRQAIERVRRYFPEAALRTSLITGFPGESDEDFAALRRFVAESRFMHLGVFAYQAEEGTAAARMPGQVEDALKAARRDEIMAIQAEISEELMAGQVGARLEVLVDAAHPEWPGLHVGRTWFQAPEVDGVTYVSGPGVAPGAMLEADIVEASVYDLTALV